MPIDSSGNYVADTTTYTPSEENPLVTQARIDQSNIDLAAIQLESDKATKHIISETSKDRAAQQAGLKQLLTTYQGSNATKGGSAESKEARFQRLGLVDTSMLSATDGADSGAVSLDDYTEAKEIGLSDQAIFDNNVNVDREIAKAATGLQKLGYFGGAAIKGTIKAGTGIVAGAAMAHTWLENLSNNVQVDSGNAVSDWANNVDAWLDEAMTTRTASDDFWDAGNIANLTEGMVTSIVQMMAVGGLATAGSLKALTLFSKLRKGAVAVEGSMAALEATATLATNASKLQQWRNLGYITDKMISRGIGAFASNRIESASMAAETRKNVYDKLIAQGMEPADAMAKADEASDTFSRIFVANMALDYMQLGTVFKLGDDVGEKVIRDIAMKTNKTVDVVRAELKGANLIKKKIKGSLGDATLEAATESVGDFAQKGVEGGYTHKGSAAEGAFVAMGDHIFSRAFYETLLVSALTGPTQAAGLKAVGKISKKEATPSTDPVWLHGTRKESLEKADFTIDKDGVYTPSKYREVTGFEIAQHSDPTITESKYNKLSASDKATYEAQANNFNNVSIPEQQKADEEAFNNGVKAKQLSRTALAQLESETDSVFLMDKGVLKKKESVAKDEINNGAKLGGTKLVEATAEEKRRYDELTTEREFGIKSAVGANEIAERRAKNKEYSDNKYDTYQENGEVIKGVRVSDIQVTESEDPAIPNTYEYLAEDGSTKKISGEAIDKYLALKDQADVLASNPDIADWKAFKESTTQGDVKHSTLRSEQLAKQAAYEAREAEIEAYDSAHRKYVNDVATYEMEHQMMSQNDIMKLTQDAVARSAGHNELAANAEGDPIMSRLLLERSLYDAATRAYFRKDVEGFKWYLETAVAGGKLDSQPEVKETIKKLIPKLTTTETGADGSFRQSFKKYQAQYGQDVAAVISNFEMLRDTAIDAYEADSKILNKELESFGELFNGKVAGLSVDTVTILGKMKAYQDLAARVIETRKNTSSFDTHTENIDRNAQSLADVYDAEFKALQDKLLGEIDVMLALDSLDPNAQTINEKTKVTSADTSYKAAAVEHLKIHRPEVYKIYNAIITGKDGEIDSIYSKIASIESLKADALIYADKIKSLTDPKTAERYNKDTMARLNKFMDDTVVEHEEAKRVDPKYMAKSDGLDKIKRRVETVTNIIGKFEKQNFRGVSKTTVEKLRKNLAKLNELVEEIEADRDSILKSEKIAKDYADSLIVSVIAKQKEVSDAIAAMNAIVADDNVEVNDATEAVLNTIAKQVYPDFESLIQAFNELNLREIQDFLLKGEQVSNETALTIQDLDDKVFGMYMLLREIDDDVANHVKERLEQLHKILNTLDIMIKDGVDFESIITSENLEDTLSLSTALALNNVTSAQQAVAEAQARLDAAKKTKKGKDRLKGNKVEIAAADKELEEAYDKLTEAKKVFAESVTRDLLVYNIDDVQNHTFEDVLAQAATDGISEITTPEGKAQLVAISNGLPGSPTPKAQLLLGPHIEVNDEVINFQPVTSGTQIRSIIDNNAKSEAIENSVVNFKSWVLKTIKGRRQLDESVKASGKAKDRLLAAEATDAAKSAQAVADKAVTDYCEDPTNLLPGSNVKVSIDKEQIKAEWNVIRNNSSMSSPIIGLIERYQLVDAEGKAGILAQLAESNHHLPLIATVDNIQIPLAVDPNDVKHMIDMYTYVLNNMDSDGEVIFTVESKSPGRLQVDTKLDSQGKPLTRNNPETHLGKLELHINGPGAITMTGNDTGVESLENLQIGNGVTPNGVLSAKILDAAGKPFLLSLNQSNISQVEAEAICDLIFFKANLLSKAKGDDKKTVGDTILKNGDIKIGGVDVYGMSINQAIGWLVFEGEKSIAKGTAYGFAVKYGSQMELEIEQLDGTIAKKKVDIVDDKNRIGAVSVTFKRGDMQSPFIVSKDLLDQDPSNEKSELALMRKQFIEHLTKQYKPVSVKNINGKGFMQDKNKGEMFWIDSEGKPLDLRNVTYNQFLARTGSITTTANNEPGSKVFTKPSISLTIPEGWEERKASIDEELMAKYPTFAIIDPNATC